MMYIQIDGMQGNAIFIFSLITACKLREKFKYKFEKKTFIYSNFIASLPVEMV